MKAAAAATQTAASVTVAKDDDTPEVEVVDGEEGGALQLLVAQMTAVEGMKARLVVQSTTAGQATYAVRLPLVTPGKQGMEAEQVLVYATQMPVLVVEGAGATFMAVYGV
jgi:hypothetical protein